MRKQIEWEMQTCFKHRIFEIVRTTSAQHPNQPKIANINRPKPKIDSECRRWWETSSELNWTLPLLSQSTITIKQTMALSAIAEGMTYEAHRQRACIHNTRKESNCISHHPIGEKPSNILNVLAKSFRFIDFYDYDYYVFFIHWFCERTIFASVLRASIGVLVCVCIYVRKRVCGSIRIAGPSNVTIPIECRPQSLLSHHRTHHDSHTHTHIRIIFKMAQKWTGARTVAWLCRKCIKSAECTMPTPFKVSKIDFIYEQSKWTCVKHIKSFKKRIIVLSADRSTLSHFAHQPHRQRQHGESDRKKHNI